MAHQPVVRVKVDNVKKKKKRASEYQDNNLVTNDI